MVRFTAVLANMFAQRVGGVPMLGMELAQVRAVGAATDLGHRLLVSLGRRQFAAKQAVERGYRGAGGRT